MDKYFTVFLNCVAVLWKAAEGRAVTKQTNIWTQPYMTFGELTVLRFSVTCERTEFV
jgi:hypothetical protein